MKFLTTPNHIDSAPKVRSRFTGCCLLAIVILLGLSSRTFIHTLPLFIIHNAGDTLWTVAIFLTLGILFPNWSALSLGLTAFALSVTVEFSQLVDLDWLEQIRQTLPGRLLLGTDFVWVDLLRYFVGASLATILDGLWQRGWAPSDQPNTN